MIKNFSLILNYIAHFFTAGNEHSVHSPFVFNLLTRAVYKKNVFSEFSKIEIARRELLKNSTFIHVTDLGAGSGKDGKSKKRKICDITANYAKSKKYCRLLYRLTSYWKPAVMIEMGTSVGISAMYQSAGNPNGTLYTLEGCPETASVARENFNKHQFNVINIITGNFDDTLPSLLEKLKFADYVFIDGNHTYEATIKYFKLIQKHIHQNSVIIFDDINWSEGMKKAWNEIIHDSIVTISIDFFFLGIVFFNKDLTKEHFKLRI